MSAAPPLVLSFAASDPTGGAGVQADILAIASLGCHPLTVLTALTVQDTRGVERLEPVETELVVAQAQCLLAEMPVAAFKLGVLGSARNAEAVAAILAAHADVPVVLDPVLASGRGDELASAETLQAIQKRLLPLTTVATPNGPEARRLSGKDELKECAAALVAAGCKAVLITGTHEAGAQVKNSLYDANGLVREDRWERLPGEFHGSGCTLASALAALLALGRDLPEAARAAQEYTWKALRAGFRPGQGQHLPDRLRGGK